MELACLTITRYYNIAGYILYPAISDSTDGPRGYRAKQNKSDRKR